MYLYSHQWVRPELEIYIDISILQLLILYIYYNYQIWVWPFLAESVHFYASPNLNSNFLKFQLCETILFVSCDFNFWLKLLWRGQKCGPF